MGNASFPNSTAAGAIPKMLSHEHALVFTTYERKANFIELLPSIEAQAEKISNWPERIYLTATSFDIQSSIISFTRKRSSRA